MATTTGVNVEELDEKVQQMYRDVATKPDGAYHFEMGRGLAERLGYPAAMLDEIPVGAIESFAGVGYHFALADLQPGDRVLDLGSGSGMDAFYAALKVGPTGRVVGVDMTDAQLGKSERLRAEAGFGNVEFVDGRIEALPVGGASVDVVISNGVINLSAQKDAVFREAARVLRPGGRLAIADIVSEVQLKESIVCNADLWASCIGGATQIDSYRSMIERAGFDVREISENAEYLFISDQARNASKTYGVKSVCVLAVRE